MPFTNETQVYRKNTRFQKGHIPWWIERNLPHPMKNPVLAQRAGATRRQMYAEGKISSHFIELNKLQKGAKHPTWRGGRYTRGGYEYINTNGKPMLFHRYVMEQYLGRTLNRGETIHHLDGDKHNCKIENLLLCDSHKKHYAVHQVMERFVYKLISEGKVIFNKNKEEFEYVSLQKSE